MKKQERKTILEGILTDTIWSSRFPLRRAERLARVSSKDDPVPRTGGIYRIHLEGERNLLAYIGQTGSLRRRLNELASGVYADLMPFTTPHIAAPSLWAWTRLPPFAPLTLSFFEVEANAYWRQGLEDVIQACERWRLKQAAPTKQRMKGVYSACANFGKMPTGWWPSSSRTRGERGGPTSVIGPWHAPSVAPVGDLDDQNDCFDQKWGGHKWSAWQLARDAPLLPEQRGLYRLWKQGSDHLWFLGRGNITAAREAAHLSPDLLVSFVLGTWTASEQEELRIDLLGLYFCQRKRPPVEQYGGEKNITAGSAWPEQIERCDAEHREG